MLCESILGWYPCCNPWANQYNWRPQCRNANMPDIDLQKWYQLESTRQHHDMSTFQISLFWRQKKRQQLQIWVGKTWSGAETFLGNLGWRGCFALCIYAFLRVVWHDQVVFGNCETFFFPFGRLKSWWWCVCCRMIWLETSFWAIEKRWLHYITQLCRHYSKPLQGSLLKIQYNGK